MLTLLGTLHRSHTCHTDCCLLMKTDRQSYSTCSSSASCRLRVCDVNDWHTVQLQLLRLRVAVLCTANTNSSFHCCNPLAHAFHSDIYSTEVCILIQSVFIKACSTGVQHFEDVRIAKAEERRADGEGSTRQPVRPCSRVLRQYKIIHL